MTVLSFAVQRARSPRNADTKLPGWQTFYFQRIGQVQKPACMTCSKACQQWLCALIEPGEVAQNKDQRTWLRHLLQRGKELAQALVLKRRRGTRLAVDGDGIRLRLRR